MKVNLLQYLLNNAWCLIFFLFSRNQLTNIPPFICQLQSLEVLLASNNKLVSLPEEIGRLDKLMDLVSIMLPWQLIVT